MRRASQRPAVTADILTGTSDGSRRFSLNKGARVAIVFIVTSAVMGAALGFLSAYLETHGEQAIPETNRLMMSLGAAGVVSSIVAVRGGNRRVLRAAATEEADAKRCAPVADRATVYVFRDA